MRYLLVIALAFLFVGNAYADAIPTATDPKNQPHVWTQSVYCAAECVSGYVVSWDFDSSTTSGHEDMCMWVVQTTTEDDVKTAGIVPIDYSIAAGATGDIIVKGPAIAAVTGTDTVTAGIILGSTAEGTVEDEGASGGDDGLVGVSIKASALGTRADLNEGCCIVFVDPTLSNK